MAEFTCPHCKQPIYDDEALLCHFCGESLKHVSNSGLGKVQGVGSKWFVIAIVFIVIASFVILMWR